MIELTDTHCHIQSIGQKTDEKVTIKLWSKLDVNSPEEVIKAAKDNGVSRLLAVGCNLEDSRLAVVLAKQASNVWATVGIHPHDAKDYVSSHTKLGELTQLANDESVVAIGECGLDYYYTHSPPEDQKAILIYQLDLAVKNNLPVIFHVREAFDDFWPILNNFKGLKGVVHSFTDSKDNLSKALDYGLYIGVNGISTFTKDQAQTEMYKAIPLDKLLLETDSPFLTPIPLRGKINVPKNVRLVAEYLAQLRGDSLETLANQTTENAINLFSLD